MKARRKSLAGPSDLQYASMDTTDVEMMLILLFCTDYRPYNYWFNYMLASPREQAILSLRQSNCIQTGMSPKDRERSSGHVPAIAASAQQAGKLPNGDDVA